MRGTGLLWRDFADTDFLGAKPRSVGPAALFSAQGLSEKPLMDEAAPRHWCLPLMARDAQNAAHFAI